MLNGTENTTVNEGLYSSFLCLTYREKQHNKANNNQ